MHDERHGNQDQDLDFEQMLEQSERSESTLSPGDRITARVIRVGREWVFLDIGTRSEGIMPALEALDENGQPKHGVGDTVTVYVTAFRDGAVICGLRVGASSGIEKTDDKSALLDSLKDAQQTGVPVEGTVKEVNKGGFTVSILGQRAFCPISQIDKKYTETPEEHVGRTYTFEITKFEESGRNIVVSRRRILEREAEEAAAYLWTKLAVGDVMEGTVSSVRAYGAFVDIGGLEGLLHVSELAYDRIEDPSTVVEPGQRIRVAIKDLDRAKGRVSLSLKALMTDPWDEAAHTIKTQQVYKGRVVKLQNFGAFVEIMPGVEGLVHISQMAEDRRINTPREVVAVGDEIDVRVLDVDSEARRISLSMKTDGEQEDVKEQLEQARKVQKSDARFGTFGDLLKSKLEK